MPIILSQKGATECIDFFSLVHFNLILLILFDIFFNRQFFIGKKFVEKKNSQFLEWLSLKTYKMKERRCEGCFITFNPFIGLSNCGAPARSIKH